MHNGLPISGLVTEECIYILGGHRHQGRAAVEKFYHERLARLSAQPEGVPTHRHLLSNLRVNFSNDTEASITFNLVYFTTAGMPAGLNHTDAAAVADVRMKCRREDDGNWRIAKFDSNPTFRRPPA